MSAVIQNEYTQQNNTTRAYSFTFPYLKTSDIKASLDAVETTAFTLTNATTLQFNTVPPVGTKIKIFRETSVDDLTATFYAGSAIKSEDLNDNFTQNLYKTQEVGARAISALGGTMTGNLTLGTQADLVFEGATDDAHETTIKVVDPTAERTITFPNVTGTVVTTGDTATVSRAMIAGDAINAGKIADNVINSEHYADGSIDTQHIADAQVTTAKIADSNVTTDKLATAAVTTAKIANASITSTKIAGSSVLTNKIADDAVTNAKIADNSIDSEHYVDGSIDNAHLANNSVTLAKMADDSVGSAELVDSSVVTAALADNAVTLAKMADASVGTSELVDDAVTVAKLANPAVNTVALYDNAVTTAKILNANVTTDKIANDAVTTGKIADSELKTLASMQAGTASKLASSTALTSDIADLNQIDGLTKQTTISDSDASFPTSGAVVDYVAAQIAPLGGLEVVATEVAFPNTQPSAGVVISISDAGGVVVNGSGVSTTGRTVGGSTVTINGFPSSLHSETLAAGVGLMVSSTGSSQTYNYHKILGKESDIKQLSDDINDFAERYRVGSSNPTSSLHGGDLFFNTSTNKLLVYNATNTAWEEAQSIGNFFISTLSPAFDGSTQDFTITNAPSNVQQIILSINGVVQKPNSGTSTPSEGFALSGSTVKLAAAPPTGSDYFAIVMGSTVNIGTPSNNTVSTAVIQNAAVSTDKIADNAVTGAKIADNLDIPDNNKIRFGTGNDLQIYHDGLDSYIRDMGTGELWIDSNGASVNIINDGSLANGKMARFFKDGAVELYYDNAKKFETTSSGVTISGANATGTTIQGTLSFRNESGTQNFVHLAGTGKLRFQDYKLATFGNSDDLQISHDGTNSTIDSDTGDLIIRSDGDDLKLLAEDGIVLRDNDDSTNFINCINGGAVELYHNGSKKLQTYGAGTEVLGNLWLQTGGIYVKDNVRIYIGNGTDLEIWHDGTTSYLDNDTGDLRINTASGEVQINKATSEYMARFITDGAVELYHNNVKKLETTATGATVTGTLVADHPLGNRNMLLNGNMRIAQRLDGNDGGSKTLSAGNYRGLDLSMVRTSNSSTLTITHPTHGSLQELGLNSALKIVTASANSSFSSTAYTTLVTHLEGNHIIPTNWGKSTAKTCTLSFYVRSNVTGTFSGSFGNAGNNRGYAFEYTISAADTWERKTITLSGDTTGAWAKDHNLGAKITWSLGHGSSFNGTAGSWSASEVMGTSNQTNFCAATNNFWEISGVQFELGSVATPVEHQDFSQTLEKCRRYYYKNKPYGSNLYAVDTWNTGSGTISQNKRGNGTNGAYDTHYWWPVEMRTNPSITFHGSSGTVNSHRFEQVGVTNDEFVVPIDTLNSKTTGFFVRITVSSSHTSNAAYYTGSGDCFVRLSLDASSEF